MELQVGEIVDVPLAQTGEGIAECELLKWYVQEVGGASLTSQSLSFTFVE